MTRGTGQGNFYEVSPQPAGNTPESVRNWCDQEFHRIANVLREGSSQGLRLEILTVLPFRPFKGAVAYFAAGVAGVEEGLYEYVTSGWRKL